MENWLACGVPPAPDCSYPGGEERTTVHLQTLLISATTQVFESKFERRSVLDFSEVMFAMKQFEQVSKTLILRHFINVS